MCYKFNWPSLSPEVSRGKERAVNAPREASPTNIVVASREEVLDIISVTIGTSSIPHPPTKLQKPRPEIFNMNCRRFHKTPARKNFY